MELTQEIFKNAIVKLSTIFNGYLGVCYYESNEVVFLNAESSNDTIQKAIDIINSKEARECVFKYKSMCIDESFSISLSKHMFFDIVKLTKFIIENEQKVISSYYEKQLIKYEINKF